MNSYTLFLLLCIITLSIYNGYLLYKRKQNKGKKSYYDF